MYKLNPYNRDAAVNYALKFALQKNLAFFDYTNQGGNCTNYISQCIYAGAPKMNVSPSGWYYFSPANTSISWANVEPFFNFITTNSSEGPFGKKSTLEACEVGDLVQLKFYGKNVFSHNLIITKKSGSSFNDIFICANTRDVKNVPLSFYKFEEFRVIHILGYRTKNIN